MLSKLNDVVPLPALESAAYCCNLGCAGLPHGCELTVGGGCVLVPQDEAPHAKTPTEGREE